MFLMEFRQRFKESFTAKLFAQITLFTILLSLTFASFYIYQQARAQKEGRITEGLLLARLLAHHSRLGIFSGNKFLLAEPIEGVLQNEDVCRVMIFSGDGKLFDMRLKETPVKINGVKDLNLNHIMDRIQNKENLFWIEHDNIIEFWAAVMPGTMFSNISEISNFPQSTNLSQKLIGVVAVTVDKASLTRELQSLIIKSILLTFGVLLLGVMLVYYIAHRITTPLNKLTTEIKAFERGKDVSKVDVGTSDEIDRLATAFYTMAQTIKNKEEEKDSLQKQLIHAHKMESLGTLAGGIAHDFNNILSAIIGYGTLLKMKCDSETVESQYASCIISATEKAAYLTKGLLAFGRKQTLLPKVININEVFISFQKILARLLREDIEFKVNISEKNLFILGDAGQIEQVIMNLVTNARDAMPGKGILTVSTRQVEIHELHQVKPGSYGVIEISDTGTGIDEAIRNKIFDPFFTTKEPGKGTGLGLSIVYGIIKQHNGYIYVDSEPGKGSVFTIYLPLVDIDEQHVTAEKITQPVRGSETILVVEDDDNLRMLIKSLLLEFGYSVIEAYDGNDAVIKYNRDRKAIDLVIMDVVMPVKNGRQAYDAIKKINPEAKIILVSGYTAETIHMDEIRDRKIHFLSKPLYPDELLEKIRYVLSE